MKHFQDLVSDCLKTVDEVFPWDLQDVIGNGGTDPLLLDIREPCEFKAAHIEGSMNVPRGILEPACDYGYDDTIPQLASAKDKDIVVICRSGHRSVLAAHTMQLMGYQSVRSLKTGVKGWNDFELPLKDHGGELLDSDYADSMLAPNVRLEQMPPKSFPQQSSQNLSS